MNDEQGAEAPGARVFAGLRMDPLFNDSTAYVETLATRRLAFRANGTNGADGWDILGIVVELDVATMLGRAPGTLFAVAAETVTAGKFPVRLDRFGRAFVKGQMLGRATASTRSTATSTFASSGTRRIPSSWRRTTSAPIAPG